MSFPIGLHIVHVMYIYKLYLEEKRFIYIYMPQCGGAMVLLTIAYDMMKKKRVYKSNKIYYYNRSIVEKDYT